MNDFTASNGVSVSRQPPVTDRGSWLMVDGHMTSPNDAQALREFFQHERDEELGRWRWPENPDYVVYPSARAVLVLSESTGVTLRAERGQFSAREATVFGAASAYFEAHPERKPWEDAKPGDVWVIEVEGAESFAVHVVAELFGAVSFQTPTGRKVNMTNSTFTGFRKIWPEDAS